ncbi:MAG: 23S rRNA (adenine(2503)-C(2))-methyltransferase RlmN [Lachnospiraceae bacterium]|nr:23S rRNA (adenine(2503)-C(2))-methyltransferase RlmN [Lachnospiraceae bacterium]
MTDIKSLYLPELSEYIKSINEKPFRAKQIYTWLHKDLCNGFDEMTNISKDLREKLKGDCDLTDIQKVTMQESKEDGTRKYLFSLSDGETVESVFMRYHHGNSVCISSQAGCRMGCKFCASTIGGLSRNLLASEMLDQIYKIQKDTNERVSNVVVMGTGEPLDNYDNLIRFIRILTDENGLNISQRNVTVSTCGLIPGIKKLMEEDLNITLAISLHAPNQKKREELMPVAKSFGYEDLIDACREYFDKTGRRITFEYSLVHGQNSSEDDARELSGALKRLPCHVNLIPVNPVRETGMKAPNTTEVAAFKNTLEKNGINATIRRELGRDIDGACGQLRHKRQTK